MENNDLISKKGNLGTLFFKRFWAQMKTILVFLAVVSLFLGWYAINIFIYSIIPGFKELFSDEWIKYFYFIIPSIEFIVLTAIICLYMNIQSYLKAAKRYIKIPLTKKERKLLDLKDDEKYLQYLNEQLQYMHYSLIDANSMKYFSMDADVYKLIKCQVASDTDFSEYQFTNYIH